MVADDDVHRLWQFGGERGAANAGILLSQTAALHGLTRDFDRIGIVDAIHAGGTCAQTQHSQNAQSASQIGHHIARFHGFGDGLDIPLVPARHREVIDMFVKDA